MDRIGDADGLLVALRRASALGIELVDAADVYAWGLTREFAAVRAACSARIVSAAAEQVAGRSAPPVRAQLRKVAGDDY